MAIWLSLGRLAVALPAASLNNGSTDSASEVLNSTALINSTNGTLIDTLLTQVNESGSLPLPTDFQIKITAVSGIGPENFGCMAFLCAAVTAIEAGLLAKQKQYLYTCDATKEVTILFRKSYDILENSAVVFTMLRLIQHFRFRLTVPSVFHFEAWWNNILVAQGSFGPSLQPRGNSTSAAANLQNVTDAGASLESSNITDFPLPVPSTNAKTTVARVENGETMRNRYVPVLLPGLYVNAIGIMHAAMGASLQIGAKDPKAAATSARYVSDTDLAILGVNIKVPGSITNEYLIKSIHHGMDLLYRIFGESEFYNAIHLEIYRGDERLGLVGFLPLHSLSSNLTGSETNITTLSKPADTLTGTVQTS